MKIIKHDDQPLEKWREGVMTRMRVSAVGGGHQLWIFDQFCDPGLGAPTHLHSVEEVLEVIDGAAEIWVGDETLAATSNQSVLIPAGVLHGFKNVGEGVLHMRATLAEAIFEASYKSSSEISRRWVPVGDPV